MTTLVCKKINDNNLKITSDRQALLAISKHLIEQNEPSYGVSGDCVYRGRTDEIYDDEGYTIKVEGQLTGLACAIGCIISDRFYSEDLEGNLADDQNVIEALRLTHPEWVITKNTVKLLRLLQQVHDKKMPYMWPIYLNCAYELYYENETIFNKCPEDLLIHVLSSNVLSKIEYSIITDGIESINNDSIKYINKLIESEKEINDFTI